jgi:hypothetical protein
LDSSIPPPQSPSLSQSPFDDEEDDNFNDITGKNPNSQSTHQNVDENLKLDHILEEYLQNFDVEDVVSSLREINGNAADLSEFVRKVM